jgi:hypothetical protein
MTANVNANAPVNADFFIILAIPLVFTERMADFGILQTIKVGISLSLINGTSDN